ncbi:hypothetical protein [Streptomyces sp. DSM 40484]|uniref:hypothetical protein n=1 Tax=Streptomyces kroppenstedtii TaxID=3051181 RepID=UPI0028D44917|nr:hypothetical protein [Streptomyces sp. DSM 40484]
MTLDLYLDKTDDELLGASLLDDGLGISPSDRGANRRFGKQWFEHKHRDHRRPMMSSLREGCPYLPALPAFGGYGGSGSRLGM